MRPPERVTEPEKLASLRAYGERPASRYEYDHFVPLELGGAVNDPRNLWPEPDYPQRAGFYLNPKDRLETALKRLVCDGRLTLADAQRANRRQLGRRDGPLRLTAPRDGPASSGRAQAVRSPARSRRARPGSRSGAAVGQRPAAARPAGQLGLARPGLPAPQAQPAFDHAPGAARPARRLEQPRAAAAAAPEAGVELERSCLSGCAALRRFSRRGCAHTLRVPARELGCDLRPPPPTRHRRAGRFRMDTCGKYCQLAANLVKPPCNVRAKPPFPSHSRPSRRRRACRPAGGAEAGRRRGVHRARRRGGEPGDGAPGAGLIGLRSDGPPAPGPRQLRDAGEPRRAPARGLPEPACGRIAPAAVTVWLKPLCAQPAMPGPKRRRGRRRAGADRARRRPLPAGGAAADEPAAAAAAPPRAAP